MYIECEKMFTLTRFFPQHIKNSFMNFHIYINIELKKLLVHFYIVSETALPIMLT